MSATANGLYDSLPAEQLAVLAAVFTQLGDTLATLAAASALQAAGASGGGCPEGIHPFS